MIIKKNNSSILIFTLLFMSILMVLVEQLVLNTNLHSYFSSNVINREKAKELALGGINLARAKLTANIYEIIKKLKVDKKNTKNVTDKNKEWQEFLKINLSHLNRWQVFKLDEKIDGFDGEVSICISCEEGKININEIFDFKKKKFKPEIAPWVENLVFTQGGKKTAIFKELAGFFIKRKRKLDDLSELLEIEELPSMPFFYDPPMYDPPKYFEEPRKNALLDIFTIWTKSDKIDPWLFSDSICGLLKLRRPEWNDSQTKKDSFEKSIEKFKVDLGRNWKENWDVLRPIYEKRFENLAGIQKILSQQFAPRVYSVISCGNVGKVKQKILAVLEAQNINAADFLKKDNKEEKESQKVPAEFIKILKIYWL